MGDESFSALKSQIFDRQQRKIHYQSHLRGLNAYDRHRKFLNDYVKYYGNQRACNDSLHPLPLKTDQDALREAYRFIPSQEDEVNTTSWEQRLVKRYYDKLFKEYCIADMSKHRTGKIGLRWRTEKEVISGKGQFICGNKHCDEKDGLSSYEVNFSYVEAGESKQALVKLVACERCAEKLQYRRKKEKVLQQEQECDKRSVRSGSETDDEDRISGVKRPRLDKTHSRSRRKTEELGKAKGKEEREGKGRSSMSGAGRDDDGIEEFLKEMLP